MQLPVFPLPVFLLPGGVTRLRIFEPRYKKLVSIATRDQGFALTVYKPDTEFEVSEWAAWVDIIDFYEEDGMLHIDVKAKSLVSLSEVHFDEDNLRFAQCQPINHWPEASSSESHIALAQSLIEAQIWGAARALLQGLGLEEVPARVCRMMAKLEEGQNQDMEKAHYWWVRASDAAPEPTWVCEDCGAVRPTWTPLCSRCDAVGTFDWRTPEHTKPVSLAFNPEPEVMVPELPKTKVVEGKLN